MNRVGAVDELKNRFCRSIVCISADSPMARAVRISNRRTLLKVKQTFQGYFLEKGNKFNKKIFIKAFVSTFEWFASRS